MSKLVIASVMVCYKPKLLEGRILVSADSNVWENVRNLGDLKIYFTDAIGIQDFWEGESGRDDLQLADFDGISKCSEKGFFICFRAVFEQQIDSLHVVPSELLYERLMPELVCLGWDVCTGDSFLSASVHGVYPIDTRNGKVIDQDHINVINEFGLFSDLDDCRSFCDSNNEGIPEHRPWYPVCVMTDGNSFNRMRSFLPCATSPA